MGHIFINNLQYFKPFHHQSTTKIWGKSTDYKKGTPPPSLVFETLHIGGKSVSGRGFELLDNILFLYVPPF
jgi:hypothetical protein